MKIGRWLFVFSLIALFGTFSPLNVQSAHAAAIEFTYSNLFPPTHVHSKAFEAWGKEIEKRTKGAVKITYYHGGALLKGRTSAVTPACSMIPRLTAGTRA